MAWNEPGGNPDGNRKPWGNRPEQGPPDLDEIIRNLQRKLSGVFGGSSGGRSSSGGPGAGMRGLGFGTIAALLLVVWCFTGIYTVDAAERGVVLRFGKYVETTQPGLRWHIPWPVETKQIVNIQSIESFSEQTRMLTLDENLVDIDLAVQFRRTDPLAYAFNIENPDQTLSEVAESAIRETIGRSRLDAVLESGRQEIAALTKDLIQRTLDSYKSGLEVTSVNLQGVIVPNQVAPSQQDAIKAREDKDRLSLEAQAYANDILPKARGAAARELQDSQAYRAQKIADAEGESQRFLKLLSEYERAPAVTRERLYLETLETVLANSSKVLVDTKGTGNMIYLPLDRLGEQGRVTVRDVPRDGTISVTRPANQPQDAVLEDRRSRGSR